MVESGGSDGNNSIKRGDHKEIFQHKGEQQKIEQNTKTKSPSFLKSISNGN